MAIQEQKLESLLILILQQALAGRVQEENGN
jgi:hypothetical protein